MPDQSVQDLIGQEADKVGVPRALALAVAEQESSFNPTAVGPALPDGQRARGTFQLLPSTAKTFGVDPDDPLDNIHGGVSYLRQLLDRHQGDIDGVLKEYGGVRTDTQYVPGVRRRMDRYQTSGGAAPAADPHAPPTPAVATPPPEPGFWRQMEKGFDLRGYEGRRNLAGAVGGLFGSTLAAPTALGSGPVGPMLGGTLGAMAGGAGEEALEQLIGTRPPSAGNIGYAGSGQGLMEIGGRLIAKPIEAGLARVAGSSITKATLEHLQNAWSAIDAAMGRARTPVAAPAAGRTLNEMIQGPARDSLDALGQEVTRAAEAGPPVAAQPLRDRLAALSAEITPAISHQPTAAAPAALAPGATSAAAAVAAPTTALAPGAAAPTAAGLAAPLPADHPLPGVLSRVEQMLADHPTISFADAHKMKQAVSEAANFNSPARKKAQQLAQAFFSTLRQEMRDPAYDAATDAYSKSVKLFTKGIAPQLQRGIIDNPEAIVTLVKGTQPTKLQMLWDLVGMASPHDPAQAQAAWDGVRGAWTNRNLLSGDVAKLGDRLAKLDPQFSALLFQGKAGQAQLKNLTSIADAYAQTTLDEAAFKASSLARPRSAGQTLRDVGHIALGGPTSKVVGAGRLALLGPKAADLARWAFTSPLRTQLLVKAVTQGWGGMAMADLMRAYSTEDEEPPMAVSHTTVGTPPPGPGTQRAAPVGQPPPAPPR